MLIFFFISHKGLHVICLCLNVDYFYQLLVVGTHILHISVQDGISPGSTLLSVIEIFVSGVYFL